MKDINCTIPQSSLQSILLKYMILQSDPSKYVHCYHSFTAIPNSKTQAAGESSGQHVTQSETTSFAPTTSSRVFPHVCLFCNCATKSGILVKMATCRNGDSQNGDNQNGDSTKWQQWIPYHIIKFISSISV